VNVANPGGWPGVVPVDEEVDPRKQESCSKPLKLVGVEPDTGPEGI
jgi:hypothetical protein